MTSPAKSGKRVVIRIDPAPDVISQHALQEVTNYGDTSRFATHDKNLSAGPTKPSLKTTKRRQSLLIVTTPQSPVKNVNARRYSEPQYPDQDEPVLTPRHTEIQKVVEEEEETIPQHHQVLYDLLGSDKAESILNPKMEEPSKPKQDTMEGQEQRRKLPDVDTGVGADALWSILKIESDKKLHKMDRKIPVEWKNSYGAFLRENINKNRPLVHRSYTHHTDVPELTKLLDKRYKDRVRRARHHTNVMFRSSENNKNKTTLLLSNNPVPDYNDRDGRETLQRYFADLSRENTYSEPIHHLKLPVVPSTSRSVDTNRRSQSRFDNLHFLTEDAARTKGKFYGKYANVDMVKMVTDFPGYDVQLPPSMKERITLSAPVHDTEGFRQFSGHRRVFSQNATFMKRDPTWQPLTVGALMEYASSKHALGMGEFRQGQNLRWRTTVSSLS